MPRSQHLLPAAALAALAFPVAASAAPSEAVYAVTFKASMTSKWSSQERFTDDCKFNGNLCTRNEDGQGTTSIQAHSRRPKKVLVMRGAKGRPPVIGVGEDGGAVPLVATVTRSGSLKTTYGGPWKSGNPDHEAKTTGCGKRDLAATVTFPWKTSGSVFPQSSLESQADDGDCPTGPGTSWDYGKDEVPSLSDAVGALSPRKFFSKQFTVRGKRTWTGQIKPVSNSSKQGSFSESATTTTTWQWEATFRRVGKAR